MTGVRLLRSRRELPAMVVALAVGIGLTVAVYALLHAVLLEPLPYQQPEHLVQLWSTTADDVGPRMLWETDLRILEKDPSVFRGLAAYQAIRQRLRQESGGPSKVVGGAVVSSNLFDVLGVRASDGRTFQADDSHVTEARPVVVSARLVTAGVVDGRMGALLQLGGESYRLVGVMPASFWFPDRQTDFWLPLPSLRPRTGNVEGPLVNRAYPVVARLASDITSTMAESRANALVSAPGTPPARVRIASYRALLAAPLKPALTVLQGASAGVLVLVCVNVGWVFLSRARRLHPAFTTMRALGASPAQILIAHLVSAAVVAAVALPCAVLLAWGLVRYGLSLESGVFAQIAEPAITWQVVTVAIVLTIVASVASCLPGAIAAARTQGRLTEVARTATARQRLERAAMTAQVGLVFAAGAQAVFVALVLLSLSRTNVGLLKTDFLVVSVVARGGQDTEPSARLAAYKALLEQLNRRGLRTAASNTFPLTGSDFGTTFERRLSREHRRAIVRTRLVTPSYFAMTGLHPISGRLLTDADVGAHHIVVTDAFAAAVLKTRDPLGQRTGDRQQWAVVGVVPAVRQFAIIEEVRPESYVLYDDFLALQPFAASGQFNHLHILADATPGASAVGHIVREEVARYLPDDEIQAVSHVKDLIALSLGVNRLVAAGSVLFAVVALFLAAVGIHAMVSYSLQARRRELGIRLALGATPRRVTIESVRPIALVCVAGACVGVALLLLSLAAIRSVMAPPPGVSYPSLSVVVGANAALLGVVVAVACGRPVKHAAATDPVEALRAE